MKLQSLRKTQNRNSSIKSNFLSIESNKKKDTIIQNSTQRKNKQKIINQIYVQKEEHQNFHLKTKRYRSNSIKSLFEKAHSVNRSESFLKKKIPINKSQEKLIKRSDIAQNEIDKIFDKNLQKRLIINKVLKDLKNKQPTLSIRNQYKKLKNQNESISKAKQLSSSYYQASLAISNFEQNQPISAILKKKIEANNFDNVVIAKSAQVVKIDESVQTQSITMLRKSIIQQQKLNLQTVIRQQLKKELEINYSAQLDELKEEIKNKEKQYHRKQKEMYIQIERERKRFEESQQLLKKQKQEKIALQKNKKQQSFTKLDLKEKQSSISRRENIAHPEINNNIFQNLQEPKIRERERKSVQINRIQKLYRNQQIKNNQFDSKSTKQKIKNDGLKPSTPLNQKAKVPQRQINNKNPFYQNIEQTNFEDIENIRLSPESKQIPPPKGVGQKKINQQNDKKQKKSTAQNQLDSSFDSKKSKKKSVDDEKKLKIKQQLVQINKIDNLLTQIGEVAGFCSKLMKKSKLQWRVPSLLLYRFCYDSYRSHTEIYSEGQRLKLIKRQQIENFQQGNNTLKANMQKIFKAAEKKTKITEQYRSITFSDQNQKDKLFPYIKIEVNKFIKSFKKSDQFYDINIIKCVLRMINSVLIINKLKQDMETQIINENIEEITKDRAPQMFNIWEKKYFETIGQS